MNGPYRDAFRARRERALALGQQISDLEAGFSEFFWSEVASTLDLDLPAEVELPDDDSDDRALDEVIAASEGRLAALQRVMRDYHRIEEAWRLPAPQVPPCSLKGGEHRQPSFTYAFTKRPHCPSFQKLVAGFTLASTIEEVGFGGFDRRVALVFEEVPFQLLYESNLSDKTHKFLPEISVQTTVSELSGELQLTRQGFVSEILIAARLRQDIKIGDCKFDGTFVIRGEEAAAEAMLTPKVRRDLLEVPKVDIPRLLVSKGLARLTWTFGPNRRILEAAMFALRGIRQAPPTKSLRR